MLALDGDGLRVLADEYAQTNNLGGLSMAVLRREGWPVLVFYDGTGSDLCQQFVAELRWGADILDGIGDWGH